MNIAEDYPARQQRDGSVWFRPADGDGWTSDPAQAHPDYAVQIGDDGTAVTWVGDPWGPADADGIMVLPTVDDIELPSITITGQHVDWPPPNADLGVVGTMIAAITPPLPQITLSDLDNALSEGYVDHDHAAALADKLISQTTVTATTTTEGNIMAAADQFDQAGTADAPRFTEYMHYPLPPAPPRMKVTYDGYGRYKLPSPSTGRPTAFSRATTIAKTLEETYNLNRYHRRQAVKAIVRAVEAAGAAAAESSADGFDVAGGQQTIVSLLMDVREAIEAEDDRTLDVAVDMLDNITGGADARELGEAVHAWLEAIDIGMVLPSQVPDMFVPYVTSARDALRRAGLVAVPEYVERIVLNDRGEETIVGTIDRIYKVVSTGELIMGDVKTSKTLEYSWLPYSVQVGGIYGYATKMFAADGDTSQGKHGWLPMPKIGDEYAVILHVPSDQPERAAVVTIDMWFGGESMIASLDARRRRSAAKKEVPKHAVPVPTKEALRYLHARDDILDATAPGQLADIWEQYQDVWDDSLTELGEHVIQLLDNAAAPATA